MKRGRSFPGGHRRRVPAARLRFGAVLRRDSAGLAEFRLLSHTIRRETAGNLVVTQFKTLLSRNLGMRSAANC
ncbi:MAG: hypothetical protein LBF74_13020 [Treponema sp.]|nr:hypothetical protein [Treponema sp.]